MEDGDFLPYLHRRREGGAVLHHAGGRVQQPVARVGGNAGLLARGQAQRGGGGGHGGLGDIEEDVEDFDQLLLHVWRLGLRGVDGGGRYGMDERCGGS